MIKWAPLNVPLRRRLQTLCIFILTLANSYGIYGFYIFFIALMFTRIWWLNVLYILYALDNNTLTAYYGTRSEWFRSWRFWTYCVEYFPVKLVKTAELDPSKNYIAPSYPHGQLMFSQWFLTGTNALGFKEVFPGLTSYFMTIPMRLGIPYSREMFVYAGTCAGTEEYLLYRLDRKKHKGNFIIMNTGGSSEILLNRPDEYNLYLSKRRGFIRVALKSGASLVPVFCFGENRVFDGVAAPKGTLMRKFQDKVRSMTKISPILPSGRGFFQYSFGMIPHRKPITVVVGAPIEVPQVEDPSMEQVEDLFNRFVQAVRDLFEEHKHKYEPDPNIPLNIY